MNDESTETTEYIQYVRGYAVPNDAKITQRKRTRHPAWAQRHDTRNARDESAAAQDTVHFAHTRRNAMLAHPLDTLGRAIKEIGAPYEGWCFVFDCETTKDTRQALRIGFYEVHGLSADQRKRLYLVGQLDRAALDRLQEAGVFYDPDMLTSEEVTLVHAFADHYGLKCLTRDAFVALFYKWVYRYGALCVGHNLPFDLSRLAVCWTRGGKDYRNGFSLKLCRCPHAQCFDHPNLRIKTLARYKAFVRFRHVNPPAPGGTKKTPHAAAWDRERRNGKFLDTATLGRALLGPGDMRLAGLAQQFNTPHQKLDTDEHGGPLTWEYLEYSRQDVTVTWEVYQAERDLYRRHGLSRSMWKIFSEASIGKAYVAEMGITPLLERHPDFPPEVLGYGMAALYGARVEMHIRLQPVEVEYCDFKSQYATINALMRLQDLLLAKHLSVREATTDAQALLGTVTLAQPQDPAFWPHLRMVCLVQPHGDRLPFRGDFGGGGRNVALPLIDAGQPTWYALPDLVESTLHTGKPPNVLKAIELVPSAERIETKPIRFFGDERYTIDPQRQDIFAEVISLRTELKHQAKAAKAAGNFREAERLGGIQQGLKVLSSATSYGIYVEVNDEDETAEPRPVTVHALSSWQSATTQVETPGAYFFAPIGALITAGGRLLLALAEQLAAERGLSYAHLDTDGITLVRPAGMSREEFRRRAKEVREWFTPLSLSRGQPPILELEDENSWEGEREPLYFLGISDKRYALYNLVKTPDGSGPIVKDGQRYEVRIRKFSSHGMGTYNGRRGYVSPPHIPPPCATDSAGQPTSYPLGGERWSYDLWYGAIVAIEQHYADGPQLPTNEQGTPRYYVRPGEHPWLDQPAFHHVTLSTWDLLRQYSADYDGHRPDQRPFNSFTLLPPFAEVSETGFAGPRTLTGRKLAAQAAGHLEDMQRYDGVPTGVSFDGPYVRTPAELREALAQGAFGWYETDDKTGVTTRKQLPPGMQTPTVAEVFYDYFRSREHKSAIPDGVGKLPVRHVTGGRIVVLGKETDAAWLSTAEETDGLLGGEEAGMEGAQVYGTDMWAGGDTRDWKQILAPYRLADLLLATGVPQQRLSELRSGATTAPRAETVEALAQGLWLLDPQNPQSIAGWRDIPNGWLAERLGVQRADIQAIRKGTKRVTQKDRDRLIQVIQAWRRERVDADGDQEKRSTPEGGTAT